MLSSLLDRFDRELESLESTSSVRLPAPDGDERLRGVHEVIADMARRAREDLQSTCRDIRALLPLWVDSNGRSLDVTAVLRARTSGGNTGAPGNPAHKRATSGFVESARAWSEALRRRTQGIEGEVRPRVRARLRWLLRDMIGRLESESTDGGFGDFYVHFDEAGRLAVLLGFTFAPVYRIQQIQGSPLTVDPPVGWVSSIREDWSKHPRSKPRSWLLETYRIHDPASESAVEFDVRGYRAPKSSRRVVEYTPLTGSRAVTARATIISFLKRWLSAVTGLEIMGNSIGRRGQEDAKHDKPRSEPRSAPTDVEVPAARAQREPTKEETQAYQLWRLAGLTQREVARRMSEEHGREFSQAWVCRACQRVRRIAPADGAEADAGARRRRTVYRPPRAIDRGRPTDGRVRRSSEGDSGRADSD